MKYCYVVVLDGCRPGEIDQPQMSNVRALRDAGRWYPRATSVAVMETIPNHTMMMTGVRPDRSGVPANSIYDRKEKVVRDMDRATDIVFPTVIERLRSRGISTATVLSKAYLYGVFGQRASYTWKPFPELPITEHAPDIATMGAAIDVINQHNPQFMFINLGDIDRVGHADLSGTTLKVARELALASADAQVGRLVSTIKAKGQWADTLLIVLADHSMDWSQPDRVISLSGAFDADPLLKGNVQIAQNGGADLLYWTGPAASRSAAVAQLLKLTRATSGVLSAHDVVAEKSLRLGSMAGDVVAFAKAGWRFSDPTPVSNPIPGNHGHPATGPIPFFLAGGSRAVRPGASPTQAFTLDVAPTVGAYFGLPAPAGGYDGVSRL